MAGRQTDVTLYFISAPIEDATFSVRVVTDGVIYTRDDFTSKLTLAVGTFRRFGINLSGYDQPIMSVTEYTKVESVDQIDKISKDNTLSFESGSFSVYVLVYTVDLLKTL